MADHADGSIIIDTEIDAQGFKAGSSELQRAIKSLNTKIQSLGPTFQKALTGNESAISAFKAKAAALESTISDLEEKLQSLGDARVPTEDYKWLTTEIEKAKNELAKLEEKQIKMQDMGVRESSKSWQSLQYDIQLAKRKIADYKAEAAGMRDSGTAFQTGNSTAEYAQLSSALSEAKNKLAEMQSQVEAANGSTNRLARMGNAVKTVFSKIGTVGKKAFSGCIGMIKKVATTLKSFSKNSNGCMGAISKLGKKLTGFGNMLKRSALRKIMMAMLTAVKDGFNNLAQYSNQTNADLSALKSGLTQLKNSFATAFAPILTIVTPILSKLIDYLSTALTYIGKLFAAMTGATAFTKATAIQEDYAASLGGTSAAAKEAKKQLAGFDELNVLSDSSSDSGASGGTISPSEMFEEVPIESSIVDFVDKIKESFNNGDYAGIGEIIGTKINEAVQKVNNFIKWDNVGSTITKVVSGVAEGFNSLIHTINWTLIGDTIAQGFNTALNTLFLIITKFDWPGLAAGLARELNGIVTGFNWGKLGTTISTGLRTAIATLRSAITTFNWASLGKCIADSINSIDWVGILSDLASGISDIIKGALDLLIGFAENLDWGKLGRDLWNGLIGVITNIDWGGILSKAFQLLGNAVGGATSLIVEFAKSLWESLKSAFNNFSKYIEEAGGNVIQGLLNGIWNGIKNIGTWIKKHIFDPFINGFKNAFGIHSPSTVMAEMGRFLIEGLLNGIKNLWSSITGFFRNALSGLSSLISNAWSGIKSVASSAWSGIKDNISSALSGIKSGISSACTAVKNGVSIAWTSVKSTISTKLNEAKTAASTAWKSIKSTASTVGNNIKSAVSTSWEKTKTAVSNKLSSIKSTVTNTFNNLKNNAPTWGKDLCSNMANGISKAKSAVENAVKDVADKIKSFLGFSEPEDGPLSNFHTYMPDMIDLMTYGIKKNQGKAIGAVSDMAAAISGEIQNGDYVMGGIKTDTGVDSALTSFSDKVANSFSTLLEHLQTIADGVTFTTPLMSTGTVVPYSVSTSVVDNNRHESSTDFQETLREAIIEAFMQVFSAMGGMSGGNGDTEVNVYIGNKKIEDIVIETNKKQLARSGGRT